MFGGLLAHFPGSSRHAVRVRLGAAAAGGCAVLALALSGCGTTASSPASAAASPGQGAGSYLTCLRQHGVTIPAARPTAPSSGSGAANPAFQKARQACASLRPSGGFGGGGFGAGGFGGGFGGQFASAIKAFRSCMADHGETIPSTRPTAPPAAAPSPGDRFLNGLNPANPKVAAALKACQSKLPSFPAQAG